MVGGVIDPLIPEGERSLIRPLPGDVEPWQRDVYRVLRRHAVRFDGREDVVGTRCLAYLRGLRDALLTERNTFPQVATGLRVRTVRSLLSGDGVSYLTAAHVVRDLHEQVLRAVEMAP